MSAPSTTASQIDFCDAMSRVNVTSEPASACDTPIPRMRISDETLNTLSQVNAKLQGAQSKTANPLKCPHRGSLTNNETNPQYTDTRVEYPSAAKPVYLRLKGLHKKNLCLASNIKIMEGKLAKNCYLSSVDFRFNINSTLNPVLKDACTRALRKCKTHMTL